MAMIHVDITALVDRQSELSYLYGRKYYSLLTPEEDKTMKELSMIDRIKACEKLCELYYSHVDWKAKRKEYSTSYRRLQSWDEELMYILTDEGYDRYRHGGLPHPTGRHRLDNSDNDSDSDSD